MTQEGITSWRSRNTSTKFDRGFYAFCMVSKKCWNRVSVSVSLNPFF